MDNPILPQNRKSGTRPHRLTMAEFVRRAIAAHGARYDYSRVQYQSVNKKVEIVCSEHGPFWMRPADHTCKRPQGCPKCWTKVHPMMRPSTKEHWVARARKTHGDKYDYSKVQYVNDGAKVEIVCSIHGAFWQKAGNHLLNRGCRLCGIEVRGQARRRELDEVIRESQGMHGDIYDYSKVVYRGQTKKIRIVCPQHGDFWQLPENHYKRGDGCPRCGGSSGEKRIEDVLEGLSVRFEREKRFKSCRDKKPLRFDFWLPDHSTCIEYQGRQHYYVVPGHFGGEQGLIDRQRRDSIKADWCAANGVNLLVIPYQEKDLRQIITLQLNTG